MTEKTIIEVQFKSDDPKENALALLKSMKALKSMPKVVGCSNEEFISLIEKTESELLES